MRFLLTGFLLVLSGWLTAQPYDHTQIARQNMPAIVAVNVLHPDGGTFTGTGFVLTPDGLIATSRHVLDHSIYTNLTFQNGMVSGEALPVATSPETDLALLKIEAKNLPHVTLGNSDTAQPGQTITVIGNPRRLQNTITSGLISQIRQQKNGTIWHQISAPISPSSSGSPVFNAQAEVISIAFASLTGENTQNLNFAIPVNYLSALVRQAGYTLPAPPQPAASHPFIHHIQKSWQILKRLFKRWLGA